MPVRHKFYIHVHVWLCYNAMVIIIFYFCMLIGLKLFNYNKYFLLGLYLEWAHV